MNIFNVASPTDIRAAAVKSFLQNVYSVLWFVENVCREFVFFWYFQQKQIYLHVFNVIQRSDYMLLNLKIECMNGWNSFSDRAHLHCIQILCVGLFQEWVFVQIHGFVFCKLQTELFFLFAKKQTCFLSTYVCTKLIHSTALLTQNILSEDSQQKFQNTLRWNQAESHVEYFICMQFSMCKQ